MTADFDRDRDTFTVEIPEGSPRPSRLQAEAAFSLAHTFCHAWATMAVDDKGAPMLRPAILNAVCGGIPLRFFRGGIGGLIDRPWLTPDGTHTHSTSSDTVTWVVGSDGWVEADVLAGDTQLARISGRLGTVRVALAGCFAPMLCAVDRWDFDHEAPMPTAMRARVWERWPAGPTRSASHIAGCTARLIEGLGATAPRRLLSTLGGWEDDQPPGA